jgi:hypothetical protein
MKIAELAKYTMIDVACFLETAPSDEIYSANELSDKFDIPVSTIKHSSLIRGFRIRYGERTYYGSEIARKVINED